MHCLGSGLHHGHGCLAGPSKGGADNVATKKITKGSTREHLGTLGTSSPPSSSCLTFGVSARVMCSNGRGMSQKACPQPFGGRRAQESCSCDPHYLTKKNPSQPLILPAHPSLLLPEVLLTFWAQAGQRAPSERPPRDAPNSHHHVHALGAWHSPLRGTALRRRALGRWP